jgi:hypothetical protein
MSVVSGFPARTCHIIALCLCANACGGDYRGQDDIDDLPMLRVVEEQRIGSVDDPDVGFSRIAGAEVDRDGNLFVLEALDHQIRVYTPGGDLMRRIGRRGSGPGEFDSPPLYEVHGDTLWTYDSQSGRITIFDRTGHVLMTGRTHGVRVPAREGIGYLTPRSMRSDGSFVSWFTRVAYSRDDPPLTARSDAAVPRILFDAIGNVIDTIGWTPSPPPRMVPPVGYGEGRFRRITIGSQSYTVPDPPTDLPLWLPLDDGYVVVHAPYVTDTKTAAFTVTRLDLAGDTVYHRALSYRAHPYTDDALDSAAAQQPRAFRDGVEITRPVDDAIRNRLRAEMSFPPYRLPVDHAWIAADGSVWIRRAEIGGEAVRWILLSANGEPQGVIELPRAARVLWSRSDTLWAAIPDELDVPWLVRYRINR